MSKQLSSNGLKINGRSIKSVANEANAAGEGRQYNLAPSPVARAISFAMWQWAQEAIADRKLIEGYSK